ncbi:hypothetical protein SBRCBS47491_006548 [Sporothrix bragantina]|uniref:GST N-terminal domain-containing protein n=1 Tax=Sporothrix bragantina TaxID=671064 RepID=A0ABP0C838_9PEZI
MTEAPNVVFYHYAFSPYARRIQWYMFLRGLPYSECMQPPTMPRPDLARLGVRHRRIPILAIGRDVYLDTRLMLRKLEQIPSTSSVRAPLGTGNGGKASPEALALERLLDVLTVDTNLFLDSARLIPSDVPAMKDPKFGKDRLDFFGGPILQRPPKKTGAAPGQSTSQPASSSSSFPTTAAPSASPALVRAESLAELRHAAFLLETTLLADGRDWILNTSDPSVSDIEAIWPFHWLASMPGAFLDGSSKEPALSPEQFPRLFAWIDRFNVAIRAARKSQPGLATKVDGVTAAQAIQTAAYFDAHSAAASPVDPTDPVTRAAGLRVGQRVVLWPTDTGMTHKDVGKLVRLTADEVVIEVAANDDAPPVLLHAPRHGFRVRPEDTEGPRL